MASRPGLVDGITKEIKSNYHSITLIIEDKMAHEVLILLYKFGKYSSRNNQEKKITIFTKYGNLSFISQELKVRLDSGFFHWIPRNEYIFPGLFSSV